MILCRKRVLITCENSTERSLPYAKIVSKKRLWELKKKKKFIWDLCVLTTLWEKIWGTRRIILHLALITTESTLIYLIKILSSPFLITSKSNLCRSPQVLWHHSADFAEAVTGTICFKSNNASQFWIPDSWQYKM